MDVSSLENILKGIKNIWKNQNDIKGIHFSGGEPFLNFELLLKSVQLAAKLNLPIEYVETSASWCTSESIVEERFKELYSAGLRRILISCSPFHAEKVPLSETRLAVNYANFIFGRNNVIVYMPQWMKLISNFGTDKCVPLYKYEMFYGKETASKMFWEGYGLISGGRAGYGLSEYSLKKPAENFKSEKCLYEILLSKHAHIDLYQNYIPDFCSGISLGKLNEFIEGYDIEKTPLVQLLVEGGPYSLMSYAHKKFDYAEKLEGYVGKCHLCVDVRKHIVESILKANKKSKKKSEIYKELSPIEFYKRI